MVGGRLRDDDDDERIMKSGRMRGVLEIIIAILFRKMDRESEKVA